MKPSPVSAFDRRRPCLGKRLPTDSKPTVCPLKRWFNGVGRHARGVVGRQIRSASSDEGTSEVANVRVPLSVPKLINAV